MDEEKKIVDFFLLVLALIVSSLSESQTSQGFFD